MPISGDAGHGVSFLHTVTSDIYISLGDDGSVLWIMLCSD